MHRFAAELDPTNQPQRKGSGQRIDLDLSVPIGIAHGQRAIAAVRSRDVPVGSASTASGGIGPAYPVPWVLHKPSKNDHVLVEWFRRYAASLRRGLGRIDQGISRDTLDRVCDEDHWQTKGFTAVFDTPATRCKPFGLLAIHWCTVWINNSPCCNPLC